MKLIATRIVIHRGDGTVEYPAYRLTVDEHGREMMMLDEVTNLTANDRFSVEYGCTEAIQ